MSDFPALLFLAAGAVPVGAAVLIAGLRAPFLLLGFYAALVPFGSAWAVPLGLPPAFTTVSTLTGLLATGALVAHLILVKRRAPRILAMVPAALVLLAAIAFTLPWSIRPARTIDEVLVMISLVGLFVVAALTRPSRRDLRRVELGIIVGGAVTGMIAFSQLLTGSLTPTGRGGTPRFQTAGGGGEGADPNITAATLILPLAVSIARGVDARGAERAGSLLAAGLIGLAIVLTGSRGGILAAILTTIVLAASLQRPRATVALALCPIVVAAGALAFAPEALVGRLARGTSSGRTDVWTIGAVACAQHCWRGAGWGTFGEVYEDVYLTTPTVESRRLRLQGHNMLIATAVEGGVLALLLLLIFFALAGLDLLRLPVDIRAPPLAGLAGLFVTQMFLSNVDFKYFWLAFIYAALATLVHAEWAEGELPWTPARAGAATAEGGR